MLLYVLDHEREHKDEHASEIVYNLCVTERTEEMN